VRLVHISIFSFSYICGTVAKAPELLRDDINRFDLVISDV
jgi:hypothetical protein